VKTILYAFRNILRSKSRSIITILGVAVSILMLCAILTINKGMKGTIEKSSSDQTLVVFQKNRY
jgi:ABC-type antimicrobial peptide transport system permease subunit